MPALFTQLHISLVVSTAQADKLIVVRTDQGALNTHVRTFTKPMGLTADPQRLTVAGATTVWEYRNMPAVAKKLEPVGKHDACYLPRGVYVTGDLDIPELAYAHDAALWIVNTRFSCLCTLDRTHSFVPRWRPPFVSALVPDDRCHLNGLVMVEGRPKYVTALGESDMAGGWQATKASGGIVIDVETNEILLRGLALPHSPRWYQDRLWMLESGRGNLIVSDLTRSAWQTVSQLPGFLRGLDFYGPLAFVGVSQIREASLSGIPLGQRLKERTCGVWVIHLETGQTVGFLRFEAGVEEIFAIQVLPGIGFPEVLDLSDERIAHSYMVPDAALAEVDLRPTRYFERGIECYAKGELEEAIAALRRCLALNPRFPHARYNLGFMLLEARQYEEAETYLQEVIKAGEDQAEAYNSLGSLATRQRRPEQAVDYFERALELNPQHAEAHMGLGMVLLQLGNYQQGLAEYEWRRQTKEATPFRCAQPLWDGRPLPEQTLLIYTEQGRGDSIQFARYLPLVAQRCKRLVVVCPPELTPLFKTLPGVAEIHRPEAFTLEFHTHLPLLSLPHLFATTLATIPATVPYFDVHALRQDKQLDPSPSQALSLSLSHSAGCRVGLVWAGSPTYKGDRYRSCRLEEFAPVLSLPGCEFYSLQKGPQRQEVEQLQTDLQVQDLDAYLHDYGDTALIVEQLDLVISVDTSVAHLAGALGKVVWTLLPYVPDWRWGLEGETTPWYPTMRLFRQPRRGDWAAVMEQVAQALMTWRRAE